MANKLKAVIPNALTLFRLVIAPLVFLCLWSQHPFLTWATLILFTLAAVTDYLDGFLSRLWRTESWLGRVLDPIADKLLVASVLVGLIAFRPTSFWITLVVYILLMRELLVSGLREAARGDDNLAVSMLGEGKDGSAIGRVIRPASRKCRRLELEHRVLYSGCQHDFEPGELGSVSNSLFWLTAQRVTSPR